LNPESEKPQNPKQNEPNISETNYKPGDGVNLKTTMGEVPETEPIKEEKDMAVNEELAKSVIESSKKVEESMEGVKKFIENLNKKKEVKMPEQPVTPNYDPKEVAGIVESVLDQRQRRDEERRKLTEEQKRTQQD